MGKEQGFPTVKGGNGDARTLTDFLYTCPVQEVVPQHKKDESQGIRGIGDQGAGEQGMGMAAGTALVTLYGHFVCDGEILFPLHHQTGVPSFTRSIIQSPILSSSSIGRKSVSDL